LGEAPPPGWFRRNALWFFPTVVLVPLLLCGGSCGGIFYFILAALRHSEPYQMALDHLRKSPEITQRIGEPVEDATWFPSGQVRMQGANGSAQFQMKVAGPKGKADAYVEASSDAGDWKLTRLRVVFADRQKIELPMDRAAQPEVEAPAEHE
jgi:hypothetical protein